MICVALLLLMPLLLPGQQGGGRGAGRPRAGAAPETQAPAVKPEDLGTVAGQVVNAVTGEPLGKTTLRLRRADAAPGAGAMPRVYSAGTDSGGRFVLQNVAPGTYRLSAIRTGFVETEYGAGDPQRAGTALPLTPKQNLTGLVFRLTPHGVITGRIVDQDGDPLESVQVQALRYRYTQGRRQLVSYGEDSTNDLGEYRVYGLPPGRYYVAVAPRRTFGPRGNLPTAASETAEEYVTTYYPGSTESAAAAPVDVGPGVQLRGFDVTMARRHTVRVRGRVTDASGGDSQRIMVFLAPGQPAGPGSMRRASRVDGNGNFEIPGVTPGSYTLVAAASGRGRSVAARLPVQVGNTDVDNIAVVINPPVTVSGRVRADSDTAVALTGLRLTLRSRDATGPMFSSQAAGRVNEDGSFSIPDVGPDLYTVMVSGLPDGFYLKAVVTNGHDVMLAGLDLNRGSPGPVDVVLSPHAGQATGVVQDDSQQSTAGATVVLVPQEKERKDLPRYYRTAAADAAGAFAFQGLDPGAYRVYAWQDVESGAWMDPEFLAPFENRGEPLTIREDGREELKVKLVR